MRYIMRYKASVHMWWEFRHWWYNHVSGPLPAAWRSSPLGQAIHKVRSYDDLMGAWHRSLDQINSCKIADRDLRDANECLREALLIATEDESPAVAQGALEALLEQAEANIAKREYVHMRDDMSEPF